MKQSLSFLLILFTIISFLLSAPLFKATATNSPPPPGTEGGSCCTPGFTYTPNTCLSDQVPGFCSNLAAGSISAVFSTFITTCQNVLNSGTVLFFVTDACNSFLQWITDLASAIASACVNYFVTAGRLYADAMCLQILNEIEPTINNSLIENILRVIFLFINPGGNFDLTNLINQFQSACAGYVNDYIENFGELVATNVPQCVNPLSCNQSTGLCEAAEYIAAESPYCDYLSPASGVRTAIGCLPLQPSPLIFTLLNWLIGISGGIAIVLIGIAGFQITTSRGIPERLASGRDLLFSALAGITLIALAVVILNFIGVNVLGLQSLGFQI